MRLLGFILTLCIIVPLLYALIMYAIGFIAVNEATDGVEKKHTSIYIKTNGAHTDLVLPIRNGQYDWHKFVNPNDIKNPDIPYTYIAIGWGDRGFYLETPTWADLKFSTAAKAAFGISKSAMHVTYYQSLVEGEQCKKIATNFDEYHQLVDYITSSFQQKDGKAIRIPTTANYGDNDAFYEAHGRYSLFYTCNSWANEGLKACDQKASLWALIDKSIFYHYQ